MYTAYGVAFVENSIALSELELVLESLYGGQVLSFTVFHQETIPDVTGEAIGVEIDHDRSIGG
jgi:hypothetical protein